MKAKNSLYFLLGFLTITTLVSCKQKAQNSDKNETVVQDPLPSWNEGATKTAIIAYVEAVTDAKSADFIPVQDRIATFDNDGNLWSEQPLYFQLYFAMDRIKALATAHPEWKAQQPYKAVLDNDMKTLVKQGESGLIQLVMASHAGMTTEAFDTIVKNWIQTAKHPTKHVRFDKLVYQPMLELLSYLRANDFKTYIVSGGGVDFMRAFVTEIYGIPEEQILGSRIQTKFELQEGTSKIVRLAALEYIDDKEGKPLNIQKIIGKKPVFASGNSDGDLQMLQWTASNHYKSFMLYLHHTDAEREWAYDRDSHIGRLDKGLDEATAKGWTLIDMKQDWKRIYPFELEKE